MKYILSALMMVFISQASFAEVGLNYEHYEQISKGKKDKPKKERKWINKGGDRIVFNFSFDNWFHGEPGGFKTKWFSFGWGLQFMYDWPINGSAVSVAIGGGFSFSYVFHNATLTDTGGYTYFDVEEDFGQEVKRSRLTLGYFEIPFELRFRTKPTRKNDQFKFAAGFKFGVRLGATAKQKREVNGTGGTKKFTEKGFGDISQIRYGPTFRFGFSSYNIFAFYDMNSLFKKDRGPSTFNAFSIGIQFNGL